MTLQLDELPGAAGVVYVAFGKQYCRAAAASAHSLREYTDLPIHVLTNVAIKKRRGLWPDRVTWELFDLPDKENRAVRTQLYDHSPFDLTLHLDADTLVKSSSVVMPLHYLRYWDMVTVGYRHIGRNTSPGAWGRLRKSLQEPYHFSICGGLLWFAKTPGAKALFENWHSFWIEDGRERDMPALFRALWETPTCRAWTLPGENKWIGSVEGYVRHSPGKRLPGLPAIQKFKPNALDENGNRKWVPVSNHGSSQEKSE